MVSPSTDRRYGLNVSAAIKVPCDLATTANITLNGEQSIDGVTTSASRVFVKNQTTTADNGIYLSDTGDWTREPDFDGARDIVTGTIITVNGGSTLSDTMWRVTNTGTITIGTTGLTFERAVVNDSASVSFTQAGTGAVTITAQAKMRETINVKDFGATGDGVTDDTAAIQAAFDSITGNRPVAVYFPMNDSSKYYRTTSTLNVTKPCLIHGDGEYGTAIVGDWTNNAQYILSFNLTAGTTYFYTIRDITIYSKNAGAVRGLLLKNTPYVTLENVYFVNCYNGIVVTGTNNFSHDYRRVVTYSPTVSGVRFTSFTGGGQFLFDACTFAGDTGWTMESGSTIDSLSFINCNFEQCTTNSFVMNGSCRGLSFIGCRTEGLAGVNDFIIDPPVAGVVSGLSITGCYFTSDTAAGVPIKIGGTGGIIRGFSIAGNTVGNSGLATNFVTLNGEGHAGVITGNYFEQVNTTPLNTRRAAVVCFANYNSAGVCAENWGNSDWQVTQSSYTGTGTGFTTSPTCTVSYSIVGNTVTLDIGQISATSNAVTFTITGMPAAARPVTDKDLITRTVDNSGAMVAALLRIKTTGVIEIYASLAGAAFTAAGTKTVGTCSVTYTLV